MDVELPQAFLSKARPAVRGRDAPPYYISACPYTRCSRNVPYALCRPRGVEQEIRFTPSSVRTSYVWGRPRRSVSNDCVFYYSYPFTFQNRSRVVRRKFDCPSRPLPRIANRVHFTPAVVHSALFSTTYRAIICNYLCPAVFRAIRRNIFVKRRYLQTFIISARSCFAMQWKPRRSSVSPSRPSKPVVATVRNTITTNRTRP